MIDTFNVARLKTPLRYLTEHILMPVLQHIVRKSVLSSIIATVALLKLLFNTMLRQKIKNTVVQQSTLLFILEKLFLLTNDMFVLFLQRYSTLFILTDSCGCWNVILIDIVLQRDSVLLLIMICDWLNLKFSFLRGIKQTIKKLIVAELSARTILIDLLLGFFVVILNIVLHLIAGAAIRI